MASEPEKATGGEEPGPAVAEVRAYLKRHPEFLVDNPELLYELTPPALRRGDDVVDMQRFMIERLQGRIADLEGYQGELIAASRTNMTSQSQIHLAVLSLLRARSLEHLISVVTGQLAGLLDLDAVALCVEANGESGPKVTKAGVHVLGKGVIDGIMGEGRDILLRADAQGDKAIFRAMAHLVRSDALVRLDINASAPVGLLALGAAEPDRFHPGQGTELLAFLGRSLEHCIRAWLSLPR